MFHREPRRACQKTVPPLHCGILRQLWRSQVRAAMHLAVTDTWTEQLPVSSKDTVVCTDSLSSRGTDKRLLATHRTRGRVRLRWGHITVVPHLTEGHLSWTQKHFGALGLTKEAFRCSSCLLSVTRMMQESVPLWINKGLNMTTAVFYHWPLSSSAQEMRGYVLC